MRWVVFLLLVCTSSWAGAAARVDGVRLQELGGVQQLILNLDQPVQHSSFLLDNPPRLVIDLEETQARNGSFGAGVVGGVVRSVRSGVRDGRHLRVVVDLSSGVQHRTYLLAPDPQGGHRLVVEIGRFAGGAVAARPTQALASSAEPAPIPNVSVVRKKQVVIAIDPGHGGKDPGAIGPSGVREKDVVLAIARRLRDSINRQSGMRAVLTRDRDVFLPLRERINVARRHKADMFISVHADAVEHPNANGSSVYMLSTKGASSEAARLLAQRENAVDLIGGIKINHPDEDVASVLLDLSQDATLEASMTLGGRILRYLGQLGDLHRDNVERAAFAVLKAPDIPSVLVETAFISNPNEEAKLRDAAYQQRLADAIASGVSQYFQQRPPRQWLVDASPAPSTPSVTAPASRGAAPLVARPSVTPAPPLVARPNASAPRPTRPADASKLKAPSKKPVARPITVASKTHVIRKGETLTDIARRYRVSIGSLRQVNGLAANQLRMPVGTTLTIPGDS